MQRVPHPVQHDAVPGLAQLLGVRLALIPQGSNSAVISSVSGWFVKSRASSGAKYGFRRSLSSRFVQVDVLADPAGGQQVIAAVFRYRGKRGIRAVVAVGRRVNQDLPADVKIAGIPRPERNRRRQIPAGAVADQRDLSGSKSKCAGALKSAPAAA